MALNDKDFTVLEEKYVLVKKSLWAQVIATLVSSLVGLGVGALAAFWVAKETARSVIDKEIKDSAVNGLTNSIAQAALSSSNLHTQIQAHARDAKSALDKIKIHAEEFEDFVDYRIDAKPLEERVETNRQTITNLNKQIRELEGVKTRAVARRLKPTATISQLSVLNKKLKQAQDALAKDTETLSGLKAEASSSN